MTHHSPLPERPALIGVDWGTTSLRAVAMRADGSIIDSVASSDGILKRSDGAFAEQLEATLAPWIAPWVADEAPPIVASGMITSRQGWLETPYLPCPAPVSALADTLATRTTPSGWTVHFITGLSCERAGADAEHGVPDVMRGEETQVLGLGANDGVLVMPGTHSKWVQVTGGAVKHFTTHMTGEVFAVLMQHSILGRLSTDEKTDDDAFARGVSHSLSSGAGLLADAFSARTLVLFDRLAEGSVRDYLSGLVIGAEFRAGLRSTDADAGITLLGAGDLVDRYEQAATLAGLTTERAPPHVAAIGQLRIARSAGLTGSPPGLA